MASKKKVETSKPAAKNKGGRPPHGAEAMRARVEVRCSEAEKRAWRAQAAFEGLELGTWLKELANTYSAQAAQLLALRKSK